MYNFNFLFFFSFFGFNDIIMMSFVIVIKDGLSIKLYIYILFVTIKFYKITYLSQFLISRFDQINAEIYVYQNPILKKKIVIKIHPKNDIMIMNKLYNYFFLPNLKGMNIEQKIESTVNLECVWIYWLEWIDILEAPIMIT